MFIVHKYKLIFGKYPLNISLNSKGKLLFLSRSSQNYGNYSFLLLNFRGYKFG